MRKIYLIVVIVVITVIGINYLFFLKFIDDQTDIQKELILEQTRLAGTHIEKTISDYQNDLTKILFKNTQYFSEIFTDEKTLDRIANSLKTFYSRNRELISNISVYDKENRYLGIYIKDNDEFVLDTFPRQKQNKLQEKDTIIKRNGFYKSFFTYFDNNQLNGNIEVEINLNKYLNNTLSLFRIKGLEWQWLINENNQVIFTNQTDSIRIDGIKEITDAILNDSIYVFEHSYSSESGENKRIISAIYPLNMLNHDIGLVFTFETAELFNNVIRKNTLLFACTFLIVIGLIILLVYSIYYFKRKEIVKSNELLSLKMIVEQFPVGMMIQDTLGKIKHINHLGQKMLFINKDENVIGKTLSNQFMISSKYLLKDGFNNSFDSNHFIHYEKDGNEIVIYRLEINTEIAGEDLIISALIDVSSLEKSRKQEAAVNRAKSDFLAKMSHEIRTPMNGIIGMSDNLLKGTLTDSQKEQVQIIKRSSDLLLNILNDILDFSKIEAGKMMLEEIPFTLSEELHFSLELFKPLAEQKNLKIITKIEPDVPDHLIGDPFRLRQVISNLISNSLKFTQSGQIIIGVNLLERYNSAISLLFYVADTGIGIPKENLKKIFANYEQGKDSISRKYGGTGLGTSIAKQLVEMMNGEIWVDSPSGISDDPNFPGSKFSFSIEVHSNEKLTKKFDFSSVTHYQQVAVLILNKIKDKHDTVHHFLDQLGINFNFRMYDDATIDSVIFELEQKKTVYHMIIIMDKPQNDGFAIARQLKENKLTELFCIIMVSSNNQYGNYQKCKSLGIDYYLIQPYESNELYKIVRTAFPGINQSVDLTNILNKIRSDLNILVAEDNTINQRITQSIFKYLGYEIDIASNGLEAIEMISQKKYDILFMDILMPDMDGLVATREIRKKVGDKLPIIAVTAVENEQRKVESLYAGMNDYITKPVKVEAVKQILIKWFSVKI